MFEDRKPTNERKKRETKRELPKGSNQVNRNSTREKTKGLNSQRWTDVHEAKQTSRFFLLGFHT